MPGSSECYDQQPNPNFSCFHSFENPSCNRLGQPQLTMKPDARENRFAHASEQSGPAEETVEKNKEPMYTNANKETKHPPFSTP